MATTPTTEAKPWYASKTVWWNVLNLATYVASTFFGYKPGNIDPQTQVLITVLGNLVLRYVTKVPIKL
jgi:hypothetical protein